MKAKNLYKESVELYLSELLAMMGDSPIPTDKDMLEFVESVMRTTLNMTLVNNGISPHDRIPVNMRIREMCDAIQSDLEDYAEYLDDFTRKAVD